MYIVQCTLYIVRCTLYIVHCTLYTVHCTLCNVHCTMYTVQCTLYVYVAAIVIKSLFTSEMMIACDVMMSYLLIAFRSNVISQKRGKLWQCNRYRHNSDYVIIAYCLSSIPPLYFTSHRITWHARARVNRSRGIHNGWLRNGWSLNCLQPDIVSSYTFLFFFYKEMKFTEHVS